MACSMNVNATQIERVGEKKSKNKPERGIKSDRERVDEAIERNAFNEMQNIETRF